MLEFSAELIKDPDLDGAYIEIPFDVQEVFGAKRVKVRAAFDGVEYRGSIVTMGGLPIIGVTKAIRQQIGKQPGDTVKVAIERDTEARILELPDDVKTALDAAGILDAWNKQSYSHQRQYMNSIVEAKKQETRERRIAKMVESLQS